jgi:hypothetical protein
MAPEERLARRARISEWSTHLANLGMRGYMSRMDSNN